MMTQKKSIKGYTLIELLTAMTLSLTVLGAGMMMYKKAMDVTTMVSQRSTVQSNARAGLDTLSQDLSQAGSGLPASGISLPASSKFGCSSSACGLYFYPLNGTTPTLFSVMPGSSLGPSINGGAATDVVTMAYTDRTPDLNTSGLICSTSTNPGFDAYPLTNVTLSPLAITFNSNTCPTVADPGFGFQSGDLVMISNSNGTIIQYVTDVNASTRTLTFGSDPFGLNVTGTGTGSLGSLFSGATLPPSGSAPATVAIKIDVVTYALMVPNLGLATQLPPRLMRQVNGLSPQPVAEQVNDLQITYDVINAALGNPASSPPVLPLQGGVQSPTTLSNIRKVNVRLVGVGGLTTPNVPVQQVALTTSVSPRSLSFYDQYPSTSTGTSGF